MKSETYKTKLYKAIGQKESLTEMKEKWAIKKKELTERQKAIDTAQSFLQKVAQDTQSQLRVHIEDIVNMALEACFPGEYDFKINFEIKRGKTEAELLFEKNGKPVDPMEQSGGGCVDLAAFALRISAWTLSPTRNCMILDEPFKWIDKDRRPRAVAIMKQLSERLKIQFLIVTHDSDIVDAADKIFQVKLNDCQYSTVSVANNK